MENVPMTVKSPAICVSGKSTDTYANSVGAKTNSRKNTKNSEIEYIAATKLKKLNRICKHLKQNSGVLKAIQRKMDPFGLTIS